MKTKKNFTNVTFAISYFSMMLSSGFTFENTDKTPTTSVLNATNHFSPLPPNYGSTLAKNISSQNTTFLVHFAIKSFPQVITSTNTCWFTWGKGRKNVTSARNHFAQNHLWQNTSYHIHQQNCLYVMFAKKPSKLEMNSNNTRFPTQQGNPITVITAARHSSMKRVWRDIWRKVVVNLDFTGSLWRKKYTKKVLLRLSWIQSRIFLMINLPKTIQKPILMLRN